MDRPATPFSLVGLADSTSPLIVASPHSGRDYPDAFLKASRLARLALRRSEDCFVDELVGEAPALGLPLLSANFPRAFCDVNREAWEIDPEMILDAVPAWCNTSSARAKSGFGTIARLVSIDQPIYRDKLRFAEIEQRILTCWVPYHRALSDLIDQARRRTGGCLLLDMHSMPSRQGQRVADIVLGDAFGTACSRLIVDHVQAVLRGHGLSVHRNIPYAGGYVTRHYGRPNAGIHVVQIEIARRLYINERTLECHGGFAPLRRIMTDLMTRLRAIPLLS
ncbi:N-formylglutamate amidohydrolase [Ameyamaea chiangmaiensis NBRC 103196]|uniref:N-formylglutamate amidohydrolase n=1 Tax=Ameyamaea chiangmaiensis TaxID=442969 RepID=A0A850PBG4_9PROT|nr:N-formylglutamate amidohydrolase [Ameyamaea chiangmaiensis]MBS4075381.1 N-formylglutamate amidohydrolase [Ameyamaea chiangmaiensis]NVN39870.1 N-formylglutamate amidohydrolase [Ameyamaea chiangmaiensis]GBQ69957.1 N-formylglutamate amidohydrolase [Ameyamaea chiangmaiensis NBRC 103196]